MEIRGIEHSDDIAGGVVIIFDRDRRGRIVLPMIEGDPPLCVENSRVAVGLVDYPRFGWTHGMPRAFVRPRR